MSLTPHTAATAPQHTDYLILGNSAAGVSAAEAIRESRPDATIVIASPEPHPVYGRPLISYLIEGKTSLERIGYKDEEFYERMDLIPLLGEGFDAIALDPAEHTVAFSNGQHIAYGRCLIATGSIPFAPPIEGLSDKANICTFMTLDDALKAENLAKEAAERAREEGRASHAIVIGAGLIGLKAAEALSHCVDRITVLELAGRILPAVLDEEGASILQKTLHDHGIECYPGISARCVIGRDGLATGVELTDDEHLDCDFIVAAVGVRPNTGFVVEAGAAQNRGLVCGPDLQTTLEDVYAAGDVVQVTDTLSGMQRPLALWPHAVKLGRIAGLHMAGNPNADPFEGGFAVNAVDFFDATLITAGIINPPSDDAYRVEIQRNDPEGSYAKFVFDDDELVGYILLNRPENAGIYTSLIEQATPIGSLDEAIFSKVPENLDFPTSTRWDRLHRHYPNERDAYGKLKAEGGTAR